MTYLCRRKGVVGVEVTFDESTILSTRKKLFLSNKRNKEKFIKLLGKHLQQEGCKVQYASADADLDIVLQSVEESKKKHVVLIGDDTDLLVLLLYHSKDLRNDVY